jgi:hypothetical protein
VPPTLTGPIQVTINLPQLQPGTYTVAFEIMDPGNLWSAYGYPNDPSSQPMPGGPLTLTVAP